MRQPRWMLLKMKQKSNAGCAVAATAATAATAVEGQNGKMAKWQN